MDRKSNKYWPLCICLVLFLTTLAVYLPVRNLDFIDFDDYLYVTDNSDVQAGLTRQGIKWAFKTTQAYNWHPLTWISHMLDCRLYGLNPAGHHFTNVLFHIINTLFLFMLLRLLTGSLWRSAFVAALFALHPLHVESVVWVSERKDVLSTFFWMLTIWFYIRYVRRPCFTTYLLVILALALGLMAKQMLVTLPLVLLLLDYWPLQRFTWPGQNQNTCECSFGAASLTRCFLEKLPLLALSAVASVIVFLVQSEAGLVKDTLEIPVIYRLGNTLVAYAGYIIKMFWPVNLGILYPHPRANLSLWQVIVAGCFLLAVSIEVIWSCRTRKWLIVGWLWYLGTLVPVIGIVQVGVQAMADRYTYIPLIGLFIIIAWGAVDIVGKLRCAKIVLTTVAVIVLSGSMVLTSLQLPHWKNTVTLYKHTAAVIPNNDLLSYNLGWALMYRGKYDEAIEPFAETLRITPDFAGAHNNLGYVLAQQGKIDEAITHYELELQIKPDNFRAHVNLGEALAQQGKLNKAIEHFSEALRIEPYFSNAHNDLGKAFLQQDKADEAIIHFVEALRIRPDFAEAHCNLAAALTRQGKPEIAILHFNESLRIEPGFTEAHYNLGIISIQQGRFDKAVTHLAEALRIKPDFTDARNKLGYALTRQGKLEQAISHYRKVLQMLPASPDAHNNLGVALAMQGKFSEAIKHFNEALRINSDFADARRNLRRAKSGRYKFDETTEELIETAEPNLPD
ncbi:MAG: tetratricopeptide repeat protein [Planctomycetota bacterium]|jgi:tetratricopeptide (TPR) repeat protein